MDYFHIYPRARASDERLSSYFSWVFDVDIKIGRHRHDDDKIVVVLLFLFDIFFCWSKMETKVVAGRPSMRMACR